MRVFLCWLLAISVARAVITPTDGSDTDIQAKWNAASGGDILTIPSAGSPFHWSTGLSLSGKGVKIQGAGSGRVIGDSFDSVAFGTGTKVFTMNPGFAAPANGTTLRIWQLSTDKDATYMLGTVTSYVGDQLAMSIGTSTGSGTKVPWLFATEPQTVVLHDLGASELITITEDTTRSIEISGIHFKRGTGGGPFIGFYSTSGGKPIIFHDLWTHINSNGETIRTTANRALFYNISGTATFFASSSALWLHNPYAAFGFDTTAWSRVFDWGALDIGGLGKIYIEDCDFHGWQGLIDAGDNAKVVCRHNLFNFAAVNSHGRDSGDVGLCGYEYYDNVCRFADLGADTPNIGFWINFRGGTGVVTDNVMPDIDSMFYGGKPEIQLQILALGHTAGRDWGAGDGGVPNWPAPRQVGRGPDVDGSSGTENGYPFGDLDPIYIWNNSRTPTVALSGAIDGADPDNAADYIIAGRDYFNDGTARPGYVKLAYPHPLRGAAPPVIGSTSVSGSGHTTSSGSGTTTIAQ